MNARFLAPAAESPGDLVALPDDEAAHLTRVLRLGAGAAVRVFNGRGAEFHATVTRAARNGVDVVVGEPCGSAAEPHTRITLAAAVLKGDKMDDVVRDAVMMGVAGIQPLVTARSEVTLAALGRGHRRERWQRIAVASVKQCGRAVLPVILEPREFNPWLRDADVHGEGPSRSGELTTFCLVEPGASPHASVLSDLRTEPPAAATIIVGPEGGWTADEIGCAVAKSRLVTLRGATLRADAVPIVALAALLARWNEL